MKATKPKKLSIGLQRLMDVANVLWASSDAASFNMNNYVNTCGTPACALGHYAAWPGQTFLKLEAVEDGKICSPYPKYVKTGDSATYDDYAVEKHFGIDDQEAEELFGGNGCGSAQTPWAAAAYIRQFIEDRR